MDTLRWTRRLDVIGVGVDATTYDQSVAIVLERAKSSDAGLVSALAVHGVVEASRDPELRRRIAAFDLVVPDGQPVRLAMNWIHGAGLSDRVYGPTLMLKLCAAAAEAGVGIYLYGSTNYVVSRLASNLKERFPALSIVGAEPSVFRPLSAEESSALGARVAKSGAGIVFIGLGCPRQEMFAFDHRDVIPAVQVCVGAAFDFHAGTKKQAPAWMQRNALEWLFRLAQEPRRLFRRYLVTNSIFVARIAVQFARPSGRVGQ